ncbi:hypothetical protein FHS56_001550 [Thermonema lapsum]|uniref:Uncharacterized protein n=1 Tax=Thermonema lapsum TaxID=28195 RepID=A0A846MRZ6_9BACT|nr:hypothetical protein [Thermonema lapsum]
MRKTKFHHLWKIGGGGNLYPPSLWLWSPADA